LAETDIFERLQAARSAKYQTFVEEAAEEEPQGADVQAASGVQDLAADFGFDASDAAEGSPLATSPSKSQYAYRSKLRSAQRLLPPTVVLDIPLPNGEVWQPRVLFDRSGHSNKGVSMELTVSNLEMLHRIVQEGWKEADSRRTRFGFEPGSAERPAPRGPPGDRSYAVDTGGCKYWVTKTRDESRPGGVKVLKRRRTGEEPRRKTAAAVPPSGAIADVDPLAI
jgi:hypothetical protein